MKDTKKKVTKALAREIAAKFFGRTAKSVEEVNPGVAYEFDDGAEVVSIGDMYIFDNGLVRLCVSLYFGGQSEDVGYTNKYPYGFVCINHICTCIFQYVDGEFEVENSLVNEYEELWDSLCTIRGLLEKAIDEKKINTEFTSDDKWIIKDKAKLLQVLEMVKDIEEHWWD